MTGTSELITNIVIDIIIITNIHGLLNINNNNTYEYFFRLGVTLYLLKKYI